MAGRIRSDLLVLRTAGYHVKDGNLWTSLAFVVVPFAMVLAAVSLICALRRSGADRGS